MRKDITKASGLWEGIEIEHTQFKGERTIFVSRAASLAMLESYPQLPHVYIAMDDADFWHGTEIGWAGIAEWIQSLINRRRKVTLAVSTEQLPQVVVETSEFRRRHASTFCLLISVRVMCPDLKGYAVKVVPYAPFADEWAESGVYVRTAYDFEKGKTVWAEYLGDKDLP